jgi:hypothetical protein
MYLVLLEIYKGVFYHTESLAFSTQITDHGPLSFFPYNLTPPIKRQPLSATRGRAVQLCELSRRYRH